MRSATICVFQIFSCTISAWPQISPQVGGQVPQIGRSSAHRFCELFTVGTGRDVAQTAVAKVHTPGWRSAERMVPTSVTRMSPATVVSAVAAILGWRTSDAVLATPDVLDAS